MSIMFSGSEMLEVALGIEENGAAYYRALAEKSPEQSARAIYEHLADEELKHQQTFRAMLDTVGQYRPPQDYAEDYGLYLKALVDSSVFTSVDQARQQAARTDSPAKALDIGIQAEKDSILFYTEMQNLVKPAERQLIEKIIGEERGHLNQLLKLKQALPKAG